MCQSGFWGCGTLVRQSAISKIPDRSTGSEERVRNLFKGISREKVIGCLAGVRQNEAKGQLLARDEVLGNFCPMRPIRIAIVHDFIGVRILKG